MIIREESIDLKKITFTEIFFKKIEMQRVYPV
jgi:hypothetical protein